MKTNLLLTFIAVLVASFVSAQSLVLTHDGNQLEPNEVVYVDGSSAQDEIVVYMDVTNTSGNAIDVLVRRYEEIMVPGASSAFCWLLCIAPNVSLSPYSITIEGGATNDTDFSGHYYPGGNIGESTISYVFFDESNPNDSTMVTVVYNGLEVGVNDNIAASARVYPNPANDIVNIQFEAKLSNSAYTFELIDITGSLIRQVNTVESNVQLNTADISEGIYFYRISTNGKMITTQKLAIKH